MTIADISAVARALGAKLDVRVRWQGEALERLLDAAHAGLVDQVVRLFRSCGWETAVEVSFDVRGERGWIDVAAFRPRLRQAVIVEAKSVVPDLQATIATLDRKGRLAPVIVRRLGWSPRNVSRVLVVRESRTARRRISEHRATFDAAFPIRGRQLIAWLRAQNEEPVSGLLLLPESRRAGIGRTNGTSPARIRLRSSAAGPAETGHNRRDHG